MYSVELNTRVRRACHVEGMSRREAARLFGIDRKTVSKILQHSVPPGYRRSKSPARPKLDPFIPIIDQILEDDKSKLKKQRHTAKDHGYMTALYGKNHLGDQDNHLPTNHGFDEFFGNLYHLNAEEEPESYYYPKDPAFREQYGPRGVIKALASGEVEDTGPLTKKRMETIDNEMLETGLDFIQRAHDEGKPCSSGITPRGCMFGRI